MTVDDVFISATRMAAAIRAKEVSSEELVQAHLERIAEVNPRLNAVVQSDAEAALRQARRADELLSQGTLLGPLHGVPFTVKDALDTAGLVASAGTCGRRAYVPEEDATVVARLRSCGAILLGKTNVPELSLVYECDNLVYGRTYNPHDLSRTPGGSCGGEAAIIAAGGSPLGLGSDACGSIRVPAHYCGIAGYKPTNGLVPATGHFPPAAGTLAPILSVGLLAWHVEDFATALPVIAGGDGRDPSVVPVVIGRPEAVELCRLRLAFFTDDGISPPTAETVQAVRRCAEALAAAGLSVREAVPEGIELAFDIMNSYLSADGGVSLEGLLDMVGTDTPHPLTKRLLESMRASAMTTVEFGGLMVSWHLFRSMMLSFMEQVDVLLCPVAASPALPHGASLDAERMRGFGYAMAFNLTGWPSVVVCAGRSEEGLPIGVQVVARPWRDDVALAVAGYLQQVCGVSVRPAF